MDLAMVQAGGPQPGRAGLCLWVHVSFESEATVALPPSSHSPRSASPGGGCCSYTGTPTACWQGSFALSQGPRPCGHDSLISGCRWSSMWSASLVDTQSLRGRSTTRAQQWCHRVGRWPCAWPLGAWSVMPWNPTKGRVRVTLRLLAGARALRAVSTVKTQVELFMSNLTNK